MTIDPEQVLRALGQARGKGTSLKQLESQLGLGSGGRDKLRKALKQLIREGRAVTDGHHYRSAPSTRETSPEEAAPHRAGRSREARGNAARETRGNGTREARGNGAAAKEPPLAAPGPVRGPAVLLEGARLRKALHQHEKSEAAQGRGKEGHRGAAGWGESGRKKGKPAARNPDSDVIGVLHLKSEGYGFVSPLLGSGNRLEDLFIPPRRSGAAIDGDVVKVRPSRGRDGRTVGEVIEVVEHRRQLALGLYRTRGNSAVVEPHDRNLAEPITVPRDDRYKEGEMVKVRLRRNDSGQLEGDILTSLGGRGDWRFEILATAYSFGFADEFDAATKLAAEGVPDHVRPEDAAGRRDLRSLPLVTIDGEDARDFDDAVHVSRVGGGGYRLVVAIADVSHYVTPGGALDREGLRRATSVYFPNTVLPMLPERLSNGICSLNPDVDRLCMVADLALDAQGAPLHADLYPGVMRSHARLTYTKVAGALAGKPDDELRPLLDDLSAAGELAKKMTAQRRKRGSIDFDLPEPKIIVRDDGTVAEIAQRPRNDAHRLVEEFMLGANEAVARFFDARGLPTVYRIHDQPDEEKLAAFAQLAETHGFKLPKVLTPKALNEFLHELEGTPAQKALNSLLLRAMMQAQYSPDNIGHYGLAAPHYLHFTSPIRRYPDLMVHRLLKEHWARGGTPLKAHDRDELQEFLAGVSAQCSERERASMKAERDIDSFYAAVYMQDKVGEEYDAVVSGVGEPGLFCELTSMGVEGLVPAETLGDGVELDAEKHRLVVGRSGKSYGVGDALRVRVEASDPVRRRITLAPVGVVGKSKPVAGAASGPADAWLRPDDLAPPTAVPKRRPQPAQATRRAAGRPPPRGSPPDRKPRRGGKPGRGR